MKSQSSGPEPVQINLVETEDKGSLDVDMNRMWDLETIGIKEPRSGVYEEYRDSISFDGQRYSVKLPWKEGHPDLPTNYATSMRRLKSQVARLEREPEILAEYAAIIEEQLHSGVIERVVELEAAPKVHHLPHQAVVRKEATTTKVRIVYDASSKSTTGASLNDCLHVGLSLNPLLFNILLRFRENRIVLVGDIEKAFLNVGVDKRDRDFLRFLWLENPPDISKIVVYRFCCVVFGLNASPFLLHATLRHHISKFITVDPKFVKKLIDSFYVDDFVGGGASSREVANLYSKTVNRMAEGGFKLRKWLTNDPSVREKIKKDLINDDSGKCHICKVISRPEDGK
ncbi:uncharacterized protein LOC122949316 [Acropora millepora]|uniref:uncharacterized protein LOC122949316 n=1 Tax=Acropora millepora TaxID=45264 RepID=UPI001CF1AB76|nr:uncharacterized protein LOC122949316 [Acropora millepora]